MAKRQFPPVWTTFFGWPASPSEAKPRVPQRPAWDRRIWQLRLLASEQPEEVRAAFIIGLSDALWIAAQARGDQDWALDQPRGRAGLDGEALRRLSTDSLCSDLQQELRAACATLAAPARQLCRTARNARLALHKARLGQLARELAQPDRQMQPADETRRALASLHAWALNGRFHPATPGDHRAAGGGTAA